MREGQRADGTAQGTGGAPRSVRIAGRPVRVADDQPTFWDRVEAGRWEPGTLAIIADRMGPGRVLLDLGAWVGPVSLLAASLGARVVALEPDPAAREGLCRNLRANPELATRIEVVARAAAPTAGTVRLGVRRKPGDSMSSALLGTAPSGFDAAAMVPGEVARLLPEGLLTVKLDIEGGEYALLPAIAPLLARPGTALLLSFHPGLLREAGDPDPAGTTHRALRALSGLTARPVGPEGAGPPRIPGPDAIELCDTWLFEVP